MGEAAVHKLGGDNRRGTAGERTTDQNTPIADDNSFISGTGNYKKKMKRKRHG